MPKTPSYYKEYEASHINSNRFLAKAARHVIKRLGPPFSKSKRGRPLKLEPEMAAILIITQATQGETFRQAEDLASQICGKDIDHVTIWRYFSRIGLEYIERAVSLLFSLIYVNLARDAIFMLDSTGINCDRSDELLKLHVLACYSQEEGKLAIAQAKVTGFNVHDAPIGEELLINGEGKVLLADAGYDSKGLRIKARRLGFIPNIKFRKTSAPTPHEGAYFNFDKAKYRLRGIVEGIFGAGEVRHGNKTRCRLALNRVKDVMLKLVGFNLRVYMRVKNIFSSVEVFIYGIMKQPLEEIK
jgi:hypothetical protein